MQLFFGDAFPIQNLYRLQKWELYFFFQLFYLNSKTKDNKLINLAFYFMFLFIHYSLLLTKTKTISLLNNDKWMFK